MSRNKTLKRSNLIFFFIYFASCFAGVFRGPYVGLFMLERGMSGAQIGVISLAEGLVTPFACLFMSFVMSKIRRRRLLYVILALGCCLGMGLFWLSSGVLGFSVFAVIIAVCSNTQFNFTDRILVSRLHENPESYSRFRMGGSIGYGIGALLSSSVLVAFHYGGLFAVYGAGMFICAVLCVFAPMDRESENAKLQENQHRDGELQKKEHRPSLSFKDLPINKRFFILYGTLFAFGVAEGMNGKFMAVQLEAATGNSGLAGLSIATAMIGEIGFFYLFPRISGKLPQKAWLGISLLVSALRIGALSLAGSLPTIVFMLIMVLGGTSFSIWGTILPAQIEREYPGNISYVAQMLRSIFYSLGSAASVAILGLFYESNSLTAGYLVFTSITAACGAIYIFASARHRKIRK